MYYFIGEVMTDILSTDERIKRATFEIPNGISIACGVDILIRHENIISEKRKTKTV